MPRPASRIRSAPPTRGAPPGRLGRGDLAERTKDEAMTDMSAPGPPRPEAVDTDSTTPSARTSEPSALPVVPPAPDPLRRSRTSTVWIGVIVFAVVLVVLLIFVLQNTQPVEVSFLGFSGT